MFRGLTRQEHWMAIATVALVLGGLAWHNQRLASQRTVTFTTETVRVDALATPQPPAPAASSALAAPIPATDEAIIDGLLELNRATPDLLEAMLPGIGPSKAAAIIAWRDEHGPFLRVEDITNVPGIGEKTLQNIEHLLVVLPAAGVAPPAPAGGPPVIVPAIATPPTVTASDIININTASRERLMELDGIGEAMADRIIAHRERHGPFRSVDRIVDVSGIGPRTLDKNRHRLTVR